MCLPGYSKVDVSGLIRVYCVSGLSRHLMHTEISVSRWRCACVSIVTLPPRCCERHRESVRSGTCRAGFQNMKVVCSLDRFRVAALRFYFVLLTCVITPSNPLRSMDFANTLGKVPIHSITYFAISFLFPET